MGVLSLEILDERLNKILGTAFIKLRRYIINNQISDFSEEIDIIGSANTVNHQKKIGSILFTLSKKVSEFYET